MRLSLNVWRILCPLSALVIGCAPFLPRPLEPSKVEAEFRGRTLPDEGLRAYVEANLPAKLPSFPPPACDLPTLTLVAFYYHPDLDVARARVETAQAGIVTAGARPNPTISFVPEYNFNAKAGNSPWTLGFTFDLPLETADKRGYRIKQAKALSDAARLELAAAGCKIRSRLRAAFLDHLLAATELEVLRAEEKARAEAVTLMERRLAVGDVSRPDVDSARIELSTARLALQSAQGRTAESRAALASALGLPVAALDRAAFEWPTLDKPPTGDALSTPALQRAGLLNRLDVQRALAEYAAAEAALQLELAKQYPDVRLKPGYQWEEGDSKYALGLSLTLPLLNQNQGPIAEAEARRKESAARFLALQAQVIGETERAEARRLAAFGELAEAEKLVGLLKEQERATELAVQMGESDRLTLAGIRVQGAVAARGRLQAVRRAQTALGALEDAVQRPLDSDLAVLEAQTVSPRDISKKESKP